MTHMECMAWGVYCFRKLSQYPPVLGEDDQSIQEKFVVIMYDISSATENRSYDSPPPHPQHKHLSFNIISVLHTKQFAYGDKKLLYVKWKPKALRTGVGRSKMIFGKCFGQYFRQLLRDANSLWRVAARLNSVEPASAIALVFLAYLCVAAIAAATIYSWYLPNLVKNR